MYFFLSQHEKESAEYDQKIGNTKGQFHCDLCDIYTIFTGNYLMMHKNNMSLLCFLFFYYEQEQQLYQL